MTRGRKLRFFLVCANSDRVAFFQGLRLDREVEWTVFQRGPMALEQVFNAPPDMLLVDADLPQLSGPTLVNMVKSENVYRQLPVVLCLTEEQQLETIDFHSVEADDFLLFPVSALEAKSRLSLALHRASRELDANPLTKLPGNTSIIQRIQDLIDRREPFALAYVDLDHFKSFNDKYGFSRGDEVLMMAGRVIVNTIRSFVGKLSFVGHVGGDDFVFILPPEVVEPACQRVIESFDGIVPHFYDQDDQERGYILSTDRKGNPQQFAMMSVSIAVVFNTDGRLKHFGEASQIAMNLKKKAKSIPGSSYVLDRRQS
ncbi:diguanylate cyclase (GGDEF) domain-containing protein [Desulfonatronum thiosulfatophilum]|uniref:diguanylate cyclase n=1 Tax=Desulfonatronum thiosulfatophilum TaxID=617002 RepID=A0A1G6DX88_9BACT|nr:diguanylate cyclase [Desulfonatronum thiosulfatophilum]SDB49763.1 diguanylate cyclase (GGDEF) domain-containing protein [Desulfonatronum thiosulfatophilum]